MARRVALSVAALIAAVSAELACEAHPDCASCTSDPPCGWCSGRHFRLENETMVKVETAHCTEGTANGPITQFCENFQFSACATPETDVVRPCEGYQSCGECVADELCGWCEDTQTCTATCGGCAFYHTELCPGKVDCAGYTRAFNCLRDHHCGYCEDDSTCRDGDRDGPNAGACSAWHTLSSYSSNATRARARAGSRVRRGERLLDELGVLMPLQQEQQAHQRFSEIGAQADPRYRAS